MFPEIDVVFILKWSQIPDTGKSHLGLEKTHDSNDIKASIVVNQYFFRTMVRLQC